MRKAMCSDRSGSRPSCRVPLHLTVVPVLALWTWAGADVFTVTADRATGSERPDGEVVIDLEGNVMVTDGEVVVTSRTGTVWQQSGHAVFEEDVFVESDTLTAEADRLDYRSSEGLIWLVGNVTLSDGDNVLTADEVTWFRDRGKATAKDSVVMTGPWLGRVTGDYAMYDKSRGSLFVTANPVLYREENGDSMVVRADRLEFFPDDNRAEAQGNATVEVPARELWAEADYLKYFGDQERFELLGSPLVTSPDGELSGDWMSIAYSGGAISSVSVEGGAAGRFVDHGLSPPSRSGFSAERAVFHFSGSGDLDSIFVEGSVQLEVKSGGEAAQNDERNTVRGDRLYVSYENGRPTNMVVSGGVSGTYSYRGSPPSR
ncbi:hypothetical protein GF402_08225 [Candidatus Fermentibacteria bacterium]|nr:hypothetical protein [Candidatus Fermentibacteria bacterium]